MDSMLKNLKTAIFNVMEKMYFLSPDPAVNIQTENKISHDIYIGIDGNPRYLVTLLFEHELASSMASDLLGIDGTNVDETIIQKCIKETANVIAGKLILSIQCDKNCNITLPFCRKEDVFGDFTDSTKEEILVPFNGSFVGAVLEKID